MAWKFLETYPPGELLQGGLLRIEYGYLGKILDIIKKNHPLQEVLISEKITPYERELAHAAKRVFEMIEMLRKDLQGPLYKEYKDEWETFAEMDTEIMWAKDKVKKMRTIPALKGGAFTFAFLDSKVALKSGALDPATFE